ncbi:uncharacterized protein LOC122672129 [Telopea speciosissima]|uniref:uncharacterized protein LOC122672129 n=1 Tax=Telopea speciosissima TaxID=54955 RepID=UPI001CC6C808|nr:uncharacterized protein LOC122672129 [Telopea speciosissima]
MDDEGTEEEDTLIVDDELEDLIEHSESLTLVGRILAGRRYRKQAVTEALINAWNTSAPVIVSPLRVDTYLFKFEHPMDLTNVLNETPWSVAGNLIVLERWKASKNWTFDYTEIWVQLHDIPTELHDHGLVAKLVCKVGEVSRLLFISGVRGGQKLSYFRARIRMDITKPLKKFLKIKRRSGVDHMVDLRYERLPLFSLFCGRIGHDEPRCGVAFEVKRIIGYCMDVIELPPVRNS